MLVSLASSNIASRMRSNLLAAVICQETAYFETTGLGPGAISTMLVQDIDLVATGIGEKLGYCVWCLSTFTVGGMFLPAVILREKRKWLVLRFQALKLICGSPIVIVSFHSAPRVAGVVFSIVPFSAALLVPTYPLLDREHVILWRIEQQTDQRILIQILSV